MICENKGDLFVLAVQVFYVLHFVYIDQFIKQIINLKTGNKNKDYCLRRGLSF